MASLFCRRGYIRSGVYCSGCDSGVNALVHVGYFRETCFLAEVFFFGSSLFLFQFHHSFFLDQWLFGLLAFVFVARVHLFVHPLFSLYTSILATPYESVGGCYSILLEESARSYTETRIRPLTHVSVDRAYQAESVGRNFLC